MYYGGEHFEKRLKERFGWDWDELKEQQRGKKLESFKSPEELEKKYHLGSLIRTTNTTIFIIEQLNILMIRVGLEWKTCYSLY